VLDRHISRFAQFAVNVMGVANDFTDPRATALRGIEATERFFHAIGMPVSIPELIGRKATDAEIAELVRKCSRDGKITVGALEVIDADAMSQIYRLANQ
jgi:alcohol dehydrogenase YqhD (iron-dependent ADH family)